MLLWVVVLLLLLCVFAFIENALWWALLWVGLALGLLWAHPAKADAWGCWNYAGKHPAEFHISFGNEKGKLWLIKKVKGDQRCTRFPTGYKYFRVRALMPDGEISDVGPESVAKEF
jgi:hypothetical protein